MKQGVEVSYLKIFLPFVLNLYVQFCSFASHVMAREKPRNPESAVFTYDVKQKGQEVSFF